MTGLVVFNPSSKTLYEVSVADNFLREFLGLMFRKEGKILFRINGKQKIHTWFCRSDLYLYYVKDGHVVEMLMLKPWSSYENKMEADYLIESMTPLEFRVGDRIIFGRKK